MDSFQLLAEPCAYLVYIKGLLFEMLSLGAQGEARFQDYIGLQGVLGPQDLRIRWTRRPLNQKITFCSTHRKYKISE